MLRPGIPNFVEATSRPASRNDAGPQEGSSEQEAEERAGLLGQPNSNYRRPTVQDARNSEDSLLRPGRPRRSSDESLPREMQQFEIIDPPGAYADTQGQSLSLSSSRVYHQFQKRLSIIASSVSSRLQLPQVNWRWRWKWKWRSCSLPSISCMKYVEFLLPYYRLFAVFFVIMIVYALLASDLFNFRGRTFLGQVFDPASVQNYAVNHVKVEKIQHYLEYLTSFGHIAGTVGDRTLGKYIEEEFMSFGMDVVDTEDYHVLLNYPKKDGRSLSIIHPKNQVWIANLEELDAQGMTEHPHVFHGYGASGMVHGRLMYAGYGSPDDYLLLQKSGVNFTGAIVLVRQDGSIPDLGMIVKNAENAGAIGCLIGSGDWEAKSAIGGGNMVVRGSVALMSQVMGDVLTPGYASKPDAQVVPKKGNPGLVNIPSLPISRNNAIHLIKTLEGLGSPIKFDGEKSKLSPLWTGNDLSPIIKLDNVLVDKSKQKITNIFALIRGTEQQERQIIIGNHRDAWCWGASSPNSGTAVMLEVARLFGEMMTFGWRPLRTIVFANWDAGEYNRIGSTEWVEDHADDLRRNGMAYINLATAFSGNIFTASGSPALESVLLKTLSRINDPNSKTPLHDLWGKRKLSGLGAAGDYGAFQHFVGMSSIDIGFKSLNDHTGTGVVDSCYDTYSLLTTVDPNLDYPFAIAQILSLLILELADSSNMPFNMTNYATSVLAWYSDLNSYAKEKSSEQKQKLDLKPLKDAVELMQRNMPIFDDKIQKWTHGEGDESFIEFDGSVSAVHRISHNARMANFEHHLVEEEGLWGREWFKHVLMAPKRDNGHEVTYFPSIRDAIDAGDWKAAQENVKRVAKRLVAATDKILN
ncbi:Zn-dependent exopeptidase [Terfezia boudieri ATCC MYA-4762]|uniref:Zn-dependent exopeptidase n=1 Tax=Terfezia boudieri ATCC MYA-4762 TaxID=1051890 RepID=A0A3N4LK47_9PEZI|nr:Zn-dependent exopeptidase [Terfezia boudieri ATCC MYA-4762]